ncbi:MAG: lysine biosynthesis protein LysW [Anaerolineae bacterium]|nr:lysine biosynthesis protein LysW [Anaerolineae bacterium]
MIECPECAAELQLAPDVEVGGILVCPDCGVELEVMGVDPIVLELAPEEEEEDWGERDEGRCALLSRSRRGEVDLQGPARPGGGRPTD